MLEAISWIFTLVALYGTYLNANLDRRGFYYWLVSNLFFCAINFSHEMMAQGFLFGIYTILAIIGIRNWKDT